MPTPLSSDLHSVRLKDVVWKQSSEMNVNPSEYSKYVPASKFLGMVLGALDLTIFPDFTESVGCLLFNALFR